MTLSAGQRLGTFEILAALGAGGMGEVYRARDLKLGRDVAIKLLPVAFVADPERRGRFQREAQLLAALNHPHIASVFGLEESGETTFLAMELVEGESLADRVQAGALGLDESLQIARQIGEALAAAHDKGIIHRDLKPANVMLTSDGRVKVLDFGLAKMLEAPGGAISASLSPTLSVQATMAGTILGTAAYMSPEQARGRTVDKRTDIWAFGCVLYEMLTGRRAFEGDDVTDTIAAVVRGEPDWSAIPPETPMRVVDVARRCLVKDPGRRFADISVPLFLLTRGRSRASRGGFRRTTRSAIAVEARRANCRRRAADRSRRRQCGLDAAANTAIARGRHEIHDAAAARAAVHEHRPSDRGRLA